MKKVLKAALLFMCAVLLMSAVSCGKKPYNEVTENMDKAQDPSIVGFWLDPVKTSKNYDDVWEYRADGSLYFHQIDENGNIKNTIDGSYKIEGSKLVVTLATYALTYDSYEIVTGSLVLRDHGTESAYARYEKTIYK